MAIKFTRTDDDYVIYSSDKSGRRIKIYYPDILEIAFVARDWHGGQSTGLYSLASTGTPDPKVLRRVRNELFKIEVPDDLSEEDYDNFMSARESIETITETIDALEEDYLD